ncbi:hypothetical protein ACFYOF_16755 [Streptomyces sp. NPDC007148]|uniref:hypothetical protein n=1 Tax=Streptomyces sp. NPDC007148 TaxID=3364775 RepID=UPI0036CCDA17
MTAYERLQDEQWPTGTFGDAQPAPEPEPPPPRQIEPWTPREQAQHLADLLEGIDGWHYQEPDPEAPGLHLVTDHERHSA